jgi:hypothetical protein
MTDRPEELIMNVAEEPHAQIVAGNYSAEELHAQVTNVADKELHTANHREPGELHAQVVPPSERRVRDLFPSPKRRVTDKAEVKALRGDHISPREEELLDLIDGHIARLLAERGKRESHQS